MKGMVCQILARMDAFQGMYRQKTWFLGEFTPLVVSHLTVDRLGPMIEIIGWNEKCVRNALKLHSPTCF
jgi:hypothetical protein